MRFRYSSIIFALASYLIVMSEVNAETIVQTKSGKIYSVSDDNRSLDEIELDKEGNITRKTPRDYEAMVRGEILKILPYGDDGLVLYTSNQKILLRRNNSTDFEIIAKDVKVKDIALIKDDIFYITDTGNLFKKHISLPTTTTVISDGSWSNVLHMVAVGTNLVVLSSDGLINTVNPSDLTRIKIGTGWRQDAEMEAFDDTRIVIIEKKRPVFIKDVMTGNNLKFGAFFQGMPVENALLFKKKNIIVIRTDIPSAPAADPAKTDPGGIFVLMPIGINKTGSFALSPQYVRIEKLTPEEIAYVERFNSVAKEISDFPPRDKKIEDYFHIYKNVDILEDAEILMFAEIHTHSMGEIWSAGTINKLISANDVVLFEGAKAKTQVNNVGQRIITEIFATREYERVDRGIKDYESTAIASVRNRFAPLFDRTKNFLALDLLKIDDAKGFFWDAFDGDNLASLVKRNTSMVDTIKTYLRNNKVFVIAGGYHIPSYDFAKTLGVESKYEALWNQFISIGGKADQLNKLFYEHFAHQPYDYAKTKVIFDYLQDKKFALFIPKNLDEYKNIEKFLPKSPK